MRPILILGLVALLSTSAAAAVAPPRVMEIGLFLTDITGLDERAETFTADFDVIVRWRDPARTFTPAPGEEVPRLYVDAAAEAQLAGGWRPFVVTTNAASPGSESMSRMLVQPDGTVTLRLEIVRVLRAPLDFRAFPFDRQVLPVHVESYLWDSDELTLEQMDAFTGFDPSFEMAEWEVVDLSTEHRVHERVQEQQYYDQLSFLVSIERRVGYYIWKIMLPMVIIVMLSWIVFWMSDERLGRRAGVSSTGMLTVIAYQFVVSGSLPRFPYLTVMDHLTIASVLVIAATMLVNLAASRLDPAASLRLDRICRSAFPAAFALVLVYVLTRSGG